MGVLSFDNPDDAADVTQEILLRIVLGLQTYDIDKAGFTTWAYALRETRF